MKHASKMGEVIKLRSTVRIELINNDMALSFISRYSPVLDTIKDAFDSGAHSASATLVYDCKEKAQMAYDHITSKIDLHINSF